MEGFLLVDKPTGWTSFDVVAFVRRIVANNSGVKPKQVKVGHSGTLDPFASGLLILMVGKNYTRQAEMMLKQTKAYWLEAELGKHSNTGDIDGQLIDSKNQKPPLISELEEAISHFKGKIYQIPPAFSAIKVNGVRSYELARQNKSIELAARPIEVNSISKLKYSYPFFSFEASVSSGTYVRTLVEDIAKKMNREAYTKQLRRLNIGSCSVDQAISPKNITEQNIGQLLRKELK